MSAVSNPLVESKFLASMEMVSQSYGTMNDHMFELRNLIKELQPMELDAHYYSPVFQRYVLATGQKPTAPYISFPEMTIPDVDVPIPGFNYYNIPYASALKDALKEFVKNGIATGGTGLGSDVEAAIMARDELRAAQELEDQLDAAGVEWSETDAGDLGLPDGKLLAMKRRLRQTYLAGRQTASKDIAIKMAELARQQQEVYLKVGTDLENIFETKDTADMSRALEAAKVEPEIAVRIFEAAMMKAKTIAEVYNAIATKANALAAIFKTEMDGYLADVEVGAKEMEASTKKYESDIAGAIAEAEDDRQTDAAKMAQIKTYLDFRIEAIKKLAELTAHVCAAMATSVSASASLGGSLTVSSSDSTSMSETYNHNFNHEVEV